MIIQLECKILDIEEVLVAFTVVIVLEGIGFIIVHELLDDRIQHPERLESGRSVHHSGEGCQDADIFEDRDFRWH